MFTRDESLSSLEFGEVSYNNSLAFVADNVGHKYDILSHNEVMNAVDAERFNESMAEEINKVFKNEMYIPLWIDQVYLQKRLY